MLSSYEWEEIRSHLWYRDAIKTLHLNHEIRHLILSQTPHSLRQILINNDVVGAICLIRHPNLISTELHGQCICAYVLDIIIQHQLYIYGYQTQLIINIFSELYPALPIVMCNLQCRKMSYYSRSKCIERFSDHFTQYVTPDQITNLDPFSYNYGKVLLSSLNEGKIEIFWLIFNQFDHFRLNYHTPHPDHIHRAFNYDIYLSLLDKSYEIVAQRPDVKPVIKLLQPTIKWFNINKLLRHSHFNIIKYYMKRSPVKRFIMACVGNRLDYVVNHIASMPPLFRKEGCDFPTLTHAFPDLLASIKPYISANDYYYLMCQTYEKLLSPELTSPLLDINYGRTLVRQLLLDIESVDIEEFINELPEYIAETHETRHMREEYKIIQPLMYVLLDEAIEINFPILQELIDFVNQNGEYDQLLEACIYYHLPRVFTSLHDTQNASHSLLMAVINNDYDQITKLLMPASLLLENSRVVSVWDIVKYSTDQKIHQIVMNTPIVKPKCLHSSHRLYHYFEEK
jgi:hypothetical protein